MITFTFIFVLILIWAYTGDKVPQINAEARRERKK